MPRSIPSSAPSRGPSASGGALSAATASTETGSPLTALSPAGAFVRRSRFTAPRPPVYGPRRLTPSTLGRSSAARSPSGRMSRTPHPKAAAGDRRRLPRSDEHDKRVGPDTVLRHGGGRLLGLERRHDTVHVRDLHQQGDALRVVRIHELADPGHAQRPEELLAIIGCKPVVLVIDLVSHDYGRHEVLLRKVLH